MQGKTALWRQLHEARRRASATPSFETEAEAPEAAEAAEAAEAKAMAETARNQKWIFFNLESPVVTTKWLWDEELKEVV